MRANYRVYAQARTTVAALLLALVACVFLAYRGAHEVENIYKDGLYHQYGFPCIEDAFMV